MSYFLRRVILNYMKASKNTITFSSKGQVVIPSRLRREFDIQPGCRAIVEATPEGILIRPITPNAIDMLHGILQPAPGEASLEEVWAEHRREERALEERRGGA
ncbi:MAG: AbrB/MazE/SpoVT family DNA-binding domain-containing protein [Candidatus Hydrogenedentes bacterium]|nr:AbrB/MazE/SpoVT family DNA-binding domain-containing protein [Candidatus Hydrogenedentota bacterium]